MVSSSDLGPTELLKWLIWFFQALTGPVINLLLLLLMLDFVFSKAVEENVRSMSCHIESILLSGKARQVPISHFHSPNDQL